MHFIICELQKPFLRKTAPMIPAIPGIFSSVPSPLCFSISETWRAISAEKDLIPHFDSATITPLLFIQLVGI